jgi:hypothetical protein
MIIAARKRQLQQHERVVFIILTIARRLWLYWNATKWLPTILNYFFYLLTKQEDWCTSLQLSRLAPETWSRNGPSKRHCYHHRGVLAEVRELPTSSPPRKKYS